jgi:arginine:pyruvate transaminase
MTFLSIGEPDLPPPAAVVDSAIDSLRRGRIGYATGQGTPQALRAVAGHLSRRTKRLVSEQEVMTANGTQHALYLAMNVVAETGDEVLVADPYYATYEAVVASSGATFVAVPTFPDDRFHLRADVLEAAVTPRSRALLLNSPSNPTGAVLTVEEVDAIGEVCERHKLWIISDEVYASLTFDRPFASPFDRPHLAERTIVAASISKSHAVPGFRTGWLAGPAEAIRRMTLVSETTSFGSQPFLADALAVALNEDHPEVHTLKNTFAERGRAVEQTFHGSSACTGRMPEGGMFVMADIRPTGLSGEQFAWRLIEEHSVVVMPGESFGPGGSGHLRIALTIDTPQLIVACQKIRALAEHLAASANC